MFLCEYVFMRTTIEIPDTLFRKTKATAALRGSTMKELVVRALEREVGNSNPSKKVATRRVKLPLVHLKSGRQLDLTNFDFDDLLA
jgi:Arc/MetJ family transcription regulator